MAVALILLIALLQLNQCLASKASLGYNRGEVDVTSERGRDVVLEPGVGGKVRLNGPVQMKHGLDSIKLNTSSRKRCGTVNKGEVIFRHGMLEICDGIRFVPMNAKLGSRKNPASSCKDILNDDWSARSGSYFIKTGKTITKVYCYMDNIPGCGGGGWTTVMKTNGHLPTFKYYSSYWTNKQAYHVTGGQTGADHMETKLPTYWSTPFSRLCLGMLNSFQKQPNWIRVNYRANSLYSVIADNHYRSFKAGRNAWKSLIPGSSLQRHCNREGFNSRPNSNSNRGNDRVRIGFIGNNENSCNTPDSRIGFGGWGAGCGPSTHYHISTGNSAHKCSADNGTKNIKTFGYILIQ